MDDVKLQISKLDAARRQLATAVRLYFSYGDPVSIHTLASAGYALLDDIAAKAGGPRGFKASLLADYTNPAQRAEAQRKLNEAENFFKHADRDPEKTLTFDPGTTEIVLSDACHRYTKITGERDPILHSFVVWFIVSGDGSQLEMTPEQEAVREEARRVFPVHERLAFFTKHLPIASLPFVGGT